jgi:hypothetical protein
VHFTACCCSCFLQLAAPAQTAGLQFSWDMLPVFIQLGNNTGPVNNAAIDVLAKFDW